MEVSVSVCKMINNSVCQLNMFYEWMQLDLSDSSFEELPEVW